MRLLFRSHPMQRLFHPHLLRQTLRMYSIALVFPFAVANRRHRSSLKADHVRVQIHDTYFIMNQDTGGNRMPFELTSRLLHEADVDIQLKIARYGRNTPLVEEYEYRYQSLRLEASSFLSEGGFSVTYDRVGYMITALENKLWQLDDIECDVDIFLWNGDRWQDVGYGVLGFIADSTTNNLNRTGPSSSPSQNITALGLDKWECQVGNTLLVIRKNRNGRRMPVLESLQLLDEVSSNLKAEVDQHGGETRLVGGELTYYFQNLGLEAHEWPDAQVPVTYDMVVDMMTGLKDCFWRVNYVESTVDLYKIGSRVLARAGFGTISFRNVLNRTNSTRATVGALS